MFEMLVLLTNEINPHGFCLVTFLFIFTSEALPHRVYSFSPSLISIIWEFAVGICRGYLPQEFAAGICRGYLPWEFAVAIGRGFFVYVSEYFFVYVNKSCLYGSKPFLYASKTFWFVRFCLLTVFLFVIAVAVVGHRKKEIIF